MTRSIATKPPASVLINPFPGLRPFREDEEYLFFGREHQVDAMVNKLATTRFLAVVGTSGSGKSSLVNCGLRPALRSGLMACAGTAWRMAQFRPGSEPMRAMARALAKDGVLFRDYQAGGLTLAEIVDTTLRMSKLGLIDIYEQANLGQEVNLLVVVDQLEELFRYRQLEAGQQYKIDNATETAAAFVNLLLEGKAQTTCPIYVVLTMRSDFLGDCSQFPGLAEAINAGQYLVPRMNREERREAISRPVAVGGAEISPVLLTRLVNDVGDNPDQLSILQHALNRTWARWQNEGGAIGPLDLTHYEAIGTMAGALDRHAERAYAELDTMRQHQICEKLFKALTDKATDPRGVRRPTTLGTLCALADATASEVTAVIEVFRKPSRSFLMPPAGEVLEMETVIDISHESLMRVWQRLMTWADEEAQSAQLYRRLADAAARYGVGKASLWRDADLQLALDWRDQNQPNETWASRYVSGFDEARAFLRDSEAAHAAELERERQQAEAERMARERELEQTRALAEAQRQRADDQAAATIRQRRLMWGLVVVAGLAVGAAVFGQSQAKIAARSTQIAEEQKKTAEEQTKIAEEQRQFAQDQVGALNRSEGDRQAALSDAQTAASDAAKERDRAKSQEFAAHAEAAMDTDPELAIELGRRAMAHANTAEARSALINVARYAWPYADLHKADLGGPPKALAVSRDGARLVVLAETGAMSAWDVTRRKPCQLWQTFPPPVSNAGDGDARNRCDNWRAFPPPMSNGGDGDDTTAVAFRPIETDGFSPKDNVIAVGRRRGVDLINVQDGEVTARLPQFTDTVKDRRIVFSPDGGWLASSQDDKSRLLLANLSDPKAPLEVIKTTHEIGGFAVLRGGETIVTVRGKPLAAYGLRKTEGRWAENPLDLKECIRPRSISPGSEYASATWTMSSCITSVGGRRTSISRDFDSGATDDIVWSTGGAAFVELFRGRPGQGLDLAVGRRTGSLETTSRIKGAHPMELNEKSRVVSVSEAGTRAALIEADDRNKLGWVRVYSLGGFKPFLSAIESAFAVAPDGSWMAIARPAVGQTATINVVQLKHDFTPDQLAIANLRIGVDRLPTRLYASSNSIVVPHGGEPSPRTTVFDANTGNVRFELSGVGRPLGSDAEMLLFSDPDSPPRVVRTRDGASIEQWTAAPGGDVWSLPSPSAEALAVFRQTPATTGAVSATLYSVSRDNLRLTGRIEDLPGAFMKIKDLPSSRRVVVAEDGHSLTDGDKVWHVAKGMLRAAATSRNASGAVASPTGRFEVRQNVTKGDKARNLIVRRTDQSVVVAVHEYKFSKDDRWLAAVLDKKLTVYDLSRGEAFFKFPEPVESFAFTGQGILHVRFGQREKAASMLVPLDWGLMERFLRWLSTRPLTPLEQCTYGLRGKECWNELPVAKSEDGH